MMNAEFEEKDFEAALYHQLAQASPNLWTPGQVFEHHFGIDAALLTENLFFLSSLGRTHFSRPFFLANFNWGYAWRSYGKKRGLPRFGVNALLQAKRPQHLEGRNHRITPAGIRGKYWRFEIDDHQQRLLEKLGRKVGRRAVVSYACPAFHLWDDLDACIANSVLPEHCSYVEPISMSGHRHWCFNSPGGRGVACSDPERINGETFLQRVEDGVSEELLDGPPLRSAEGELQFFANAIREVATDEATGNNGLARAIARRIDNLRLLGSETAPGINSFLSVVVFAELVGCQWFVVGTSGVSGAAS